MAAMRFSPATSPGAIKATVGYEANPLKKLYDSIKLSRIIIWAKTVNNSHVTSFLSTRGLDIESIQNYQNWVDDLYCPTSTAAMAKITSRMKRIFSSSHFCIFSLQPCATEKIKVVLFKKKHTHYVLSGKSSIQKYLIVNCTGDI